MKNPVTADDLIALLDQALDSPTVQGIMDRLGPWEEGEKGRDDGKMFFKCAAHGIDLVFCHDILEAIHLYSDIGLGRQQEGYSQYSFELPDGFVFGEPKSGIADRLGKPAIGSGVYWGIYRFDDHAVRVGYTGDVLSHLNVLSLNSDILTDG